MWIRIYALEICQVSLVEDLKQTFFPYWCFIGCPICFIFSNNMTMCHLTIFIAIDLSCLFVVLNFKIKHHATSFKFHNYNKLFFKYCLVEIIVRSSHNTVHQSTILSTIIHKYENIVALHQINYQPCCQISRENIDSQQVYPKVLWYSTKKSSQVSCFIPRMKDPFALLVFYQINQ